ncbi:hypothetical protein Ddc_17545 [Ditylenchus destructor]|nr:hypothetical protein Ddc_17545 [Ditylenchus destructor]
MIATLISLSILCFVVAAQAHPSGYPVSIQSDDDESPAAVDPALWLRAQYAHRNPEMAMREAALLRAMYQAAMMRGEPQDELDIAADPRLYRASRSNGKPTFIRFGKRSATEPKDKKAFEP